MTRNHQIGSDGDVAVVGAGLAGLAAARHLQSRGREPVLFESTDRVGGRQRSSPLGGTVVEEGAVFFGNHYPNLWRCLRAFGLASELKTYDVTTMQSLEAQRGEPQGSSRLLSGSPLAVLDSELSPNEKAKLALTLARLAPRSPQLRNMLSREVSSRWLRRLDDLTAAHWFDERVGPRFTDSIVGPIIESLSFADATEWSALGALMLMTFSATSELNAVLGGNDRIAKGIAEGLDLRTDATVSRISPGAGGVQVEWTEAGSSASAGFRDVVLATPGPVAAGLLSGEVAEAVASIRYSSSVVPAIVTESALDVPAASFYEADGANPISGLTIERPLDDGPILCFGNVRSPWREETLVGPDDDAIQLLVEVIEAGTGVRPEPTASKVIRWRHSIPVGEPGMLRRQRHIRETAARVPHLELAGDYMVSPSQEGALVSGVRAANALL